MHLLRVLSFFVALFTLMMGSASAQVGRFGCYDLFQYCQNSETYLRTYKAQSPEMATQASLCVSYFAGFLDGSATFSGAWTSPPFCVPSIETPQQSALIFLTWADKHFEELNQPAALCVLHMLNENFPCPAAKD